MSGALRPVRRTTGLLAALLAWSAFVPVPGGADGGSAVPPAAPAATGEGAHEAGVPAAQTPPAGDAGLERPARGAPSSLPDSLTAYLVTVDRGPAVWERFGHNLLWIHDPGAGTDLGYNYGLFSFEQENFLLRFIRGHMEYWMGGIDIQAQIRAYSRDGRAIEIQELDLSVDEVAELQAFLEWNERPENRFYAYDYYRDNCSTRVRDALDLVLGGRLRAWAADRTTDASYRDRTLRMTSGLFWVSAGMHFGLGPSVDDPLPLWDAFFIPMELRDHIADLPAEPGGSTSMVRRQWTATEGVIPPAPEATPRWLVGFGVAGVLLAAIFVGAGLGAGREPGWSYRSLRWLTVAWLGAVGTLGLLIALLWAFTDHVDTHGNLNLFHAGPLHLALAMVWPWAAGRRWASRTSARIALFIAALTVIGIAVQALPGPHQTNGEFLLLLVPGNLALAWSVGRIEGARVRRLEGRGSTP